MASPKLLDSTKNNRRKSSLSSKAYGGKNDKRWVDLFPTKNKKDIQRISWLTLKSKWNSGWLRLPKD